MQGEVEEEMEEVEEEVVEEVEDEGGNHNSVLLCPG